MWQNLMSSISLTCFTCPMFLKGTRTSIYWRALMLHQDTRSPGPTELKNQAKLHLCYKQSIKRVACLNIPRYFNLIMGLSLKVKWQKFLEKHNVDIQRATTKYKHTHTAFVETFYKELAKLLFKPMDAQELQDPEKVSTIWVKNLNKIVNKLNNTVSSMIGMKPKDAIRVDTVLLDQTYPEETVLPKDRLYRYLYQPCEQHRDQERRATDFI